MKQPAGTAFTRVCLALVLGAAALASGCASSKMPAGELAAARSSISEARSAGADLAQAESKLALSGRWVQARDFGPAAWLAEQAQVDAELATVRAATAEALRARAREERAVAALLKTSSPSL